METLQYIVMAMAIAVPFGYAVVNLRGGKTVTAYALFCALIVTAALQAFDLLSVVYGADSIAWKKFALVSESFLPAAWLLFSVTFSRKLEARSISMWNKALLVISVVFPAAALYLPAGEFFYSPDLETERMLFLGTAGFVFYIGVLVYMVVSAINIEATLRLAPRAERWKIKFETLGAGLLLAMLIFYYSQGFLYRAINMELMTVRALVICLAVGLMAYSRLTRGNGVKVAVSKDMAFRSVVIIIVGLYLIGLGLIGEGMRYFGASLHRNILIFIVFLSAIALLTALLSETMNRKIKVFLHKNFFSNKYDYRAQWLWFTKRLSSSKSSGEVLTAILSGFTETFALQGAALFLAEEEGGEGFLCASRFEMDPVNRVFTKDSAIVRQMDADRRVLNVNDKSPAPEAAEEMGYLRSKGVAFVVPLFFKDSVDGFIMLRSPINENEIYTYEDYDLMKTLASQASSTILNLRLSDELSRAREMEAAGKVSAFVMHDLKNLASTISLMAENAREFIADPEFQEDMLSSLEVTVGRMKGLISRLKNIKEKTTLKREMADLSRIVNDTVGLVTAGDVLVSSAPAYSEVDPEEIHKVVLNLVLNAIEATTGNEPVNVQVGMNGSAYIRVRDRGCGMSEDFLKHRLFKPFQTTKKKGIGIGLYQCRQIIEAHGGKIDVKSAEGEGSEFTVSLPPAEGHAHQAN